MKENRDENQIKSDTKVYFYVAIGACVLAAVAFGLSFSFMGIYALISSIIFELCALSFLSTQKKKNNFPAVKIVLIITYILLAISVIMFLGGLIYAAIV